MKQLNRIQMLVNRSLTAMNTRSWQNDKRIKVLIHTNPYFTARSWIEAFEKESPDYTNAVELSFTKNKYAFLKLLPGANRVFAFGLNSNTDLSTTKVSDIYFGTTGLEFLEGRKLPEGIRVFSSQGISKNAIADHVLMATLVLKSRYYLSSGNQLLNLWNQKGIVDKPFREINQHIIGILGVGNIGKEIAVKFKNLGCRVLGLDEKQDSTTAIDEWFQPGELNEFLSIPDVLVISLPLTQRTRGLIGKDQLNRMKPDSYLINISRGAIVKEDDLVKAVMKKWIAGAALDVFQKEPLPKSSKLWGMNNIVITPHIAGNINMFRDPIQHDFISKVIEPAFRKKDV